MPDPHIGVEINSQLELASEAGSGYTIYSGSSRGDV